MKKILIGVCATVVMIVAGSTFYSCQKDRELDTAKNQVVKPVGAIGYEDVVITYELDYKNNSCYRITTYVQRDWDTHIILCIYGSIKDKIDCYKMEVQDNMLNLDMQMKAAVAAELVGIIESTTMTASEKDSKRRAIVRDFHSYVISIDGEPLTVDFVKEITLSIEIEDGFVVDEIFIINYEYIKTVHWQSIIADID